MSGGHALGVEVMARNVRCDPEAAPANRSQQIGVAKACPNDGALERAVQLPQRQATLVPTHSLRRRRAPNREHRELRQVASSSHAHTGSMDGFGARDGHGRQVYILDS